jgi:hypothetical protein
LAEAVIKLNFLLVHYINQLIATNIFVYDEILSADVWGTVASLFVFKADPQMSQMDADQG